MNLQLIEIDISSFHLRIKKKQRGKSDQKDSSITIVFINKNKKLKSLKETIGKLNSFVNCLFEKFSD